MKHEPISKTFKFTGRTTKDGWFTLTKSIRDEFGDRWRPKSWDEATVTILSPERKKEVKRNAHIAENGSMSLSPQLTDYQKITVELTCFFDDRRIEMTIRRVDQVDQE